MTAAIIVYGEVTEDGRLIIDALPPDAPRGQVQVMITNVTESGLTPEEEAELTALELNPEGMGLTTDQIAQAPEIGLWKDRTDIKDSVEFVNELRRQNRERRANRD